MQSLEKLSWVRLRGISFHSVPTPARYLHGTLLGEQGHQGVSSLSRAIVMDGHRQWKKQKLINTPSRSSSEDRTSSWKHSVTVPAETIPSPTCSILHKLCSQTYFKFSTPLNISIFHDFPPQLFRSVRLHQLAFVCIQYCPRYKINIGWSPFDNKLAKSRPITPLNLMVQLIVHNISSSINLRT